MQHVGTDSRLRALHLPLPAWRFRALTVQGVLLVFASFLLPAAAHGFGLPVRWILPMHWPVILVGLCYGWKSGLLVGLAAPGLSFLLSGRPLPLVLPAMSIELATYGLLAGLAVAHLRWNRWLATGLSLVGGRVVFVATVVFLGSHVEPLAVYLRAAMLPGLAAGAAQLVLLPALAGWWYRRESQAETSRGSSERE